MALQSKLFKGNPRLEACLVHDSSHIMLGAVGDYVSKIQQALCLVDNSTIAAPELAAGSYGPSTAAAVLAYKTKRNIINRSYQTQADNIVGKMTIASLDREMLGKEQKRGALIENSVGLEGANSPNDVLIVQNALTVWRARRGHSWISIDGWAGPETIGALRNFQEFSHLPANGLVTRGDMTEDRLLSFLGEQAAVFGPTLAELLLLLDPLEELAEVAPPRVKDYYYRVTARLRVLRNYSDLTRGLMSQPFLTLESLQTQSPEYVGITGVEESAAALFTVMLLVALLAMVMIMTQSPAFRKAVEVRAEELDRIISELRIHNGHAARGAVEFLILITNETIDRANRCRKSPTFTPSPECEEAIRYFKEVVQRIRNEVDKIWVLIQEWMLNTRKGILDGGRLRAQTNGLLRRLVQNVDELARALAEMKEKCHCPDA